MSLATNPNITMMAIRKLLTCQDYNVLEHLICNQSVPKETLMDLQMHTEDKDLLKLIKNVLRQKNDI